MHARLWTKRIGVGFGAPTNTNESGILATRAAVLVGRGQVNNTWLIGLISTSYEGSGLGFRCLACPSLPGRLIDLPTRALRRSKQHTTVPKRKDSVSRRIPSSKFLHSSWQNWHILGHAWRGSPWRLGGIEFREQVSFLFLHLSIDSPRSRVCNLTCGWRGSIAKHGQPLGKQLRCRGSLADNSIRPLGRGDVDEPKASLATRANERGSSGSDTWCCHF
jgi:hypothetical protein